MKRECIILIGLIIFLNFRLLGQEICLTPIDSKGSIEYNAKRSQFKTLQSQSSMQALPIIMVNVAFHSYQNAATSANTSQIITQLNTVFSPHRIQFVKICDNFYQTGNQSMMELPCAINIFISQTSSNPYAKGIGSNAFYIAPGILIPLLYPMKWVIV